MRISLVTVLSGLTALAFAEAIPAPQAGQENRPRYYFPRVIDKRASGNSSSSAASSSDGLLNQLSAVLNPSSTTAAAAVQTTPSAILSVSIALTTSAAGTPSVQQSVITTSGLPSLTTSEVQIGSPLTTPQGTGLSTTDLGLSTSLSVALPTTSEIILQTTPVTTDPPVTAQAFTTTPVSVDAPTTSAYLTTTASYITSEIPTTTVAFITTPSQDVPTTTEPILTTTPFVQTTATPSTDPIHPTTSAIFTTTPSDPYTTPGTSTPAVIATTSDINVQTTSSIGSYVTTTPSVDPPMTTAVAATTTPGSLSAADTVVPTTAASTSASPSSSLTGSSDVSTGPQSIKPTATNTLTSLQENSVIVTASSSAKVTDESSSSTASVIPTSLPRIIQPNGGVPVAPNNGTLIQLGFTYGLNYPFVVSNNWAVQQIFDYLPPGVAHAINVDKSYVIMQYLQPYNTLAKNGYITTLAMAYIPSDQVNPLSLALLNPKSALYNNDNPTVKTLMGMLDPSIPLLAGATIGDGNPINSANTAQTTGSTTKNGGAAGGEETTGTTVKPSSVGIGLGVVGGAAAYGVAMFMVAKRYKRRKNQHKRSSSVHSGSSGSTGSRPGEHSNLMAGGRNSYGSRQPPSGPTPGRESRTSDRSGQSGRTYISPPVMAENSLGWN